MMFTNPGLYKPWDGSAALLQDIWEKQRERRLAAQDADREAQHQAEIQSWREANQSWQDYCTQIKGALQELKTSRNRVGGIQQAYKRRMLELADLAGMTDAEKELMVEQADREGRAMGDKWSTEEGITA